MGRVSTLCACGGFLLASFLPPLQTEGRSTQVYLDGNRIELQFPPLTAKQKPFALGPWEFGAALEHPKAGDPQKPNDKRLNLYLVVPGRQYVSADAPELDHNLILNAAPAEEGETEMDLYYAAILDPKLITDFQDEHALILAVQSRFVPSDLFEFRDIPSAQVLASRLNINSLRDLKKFRRRDGSLPRVVLLPAGVTFQAHLQVAPGPSAILDQKR
jgi:hypothetical protein